MADPTPPRRRRPFEDQPQAEPFWRSGEFRLFARFAGLLIFLGIAGFYFWLSHQGSSLPDRADVGQEAARTTPVSPAELAERERKLYSAFEGALSDSKNGDGLVETAGYYKLLKTIGDYTPEELTQRAQRPLSYAACLADPDGWRGEFVWARGIIGGLDAVKLDTKAYGRDVVYRGFLAESDATRGVIFDLTEYPGEKPSIQYDAYDVEGIFYRLVKYPSRTGELREVPWLIVRNLKPVPNAHEGRQAFLAQFGPWLLGGMALVLVAVLVYSLRRGPRRPGRTARPANESIREMFERRLREEGSPPPPPASP
ncbi:MAG: hypothetical protein IPJ77_02705 [Planctomycetes bacterium]|nr:hypothetical protein [Planctomycetota bacterium]